MECKVWEKYRKLYYEDRKAFHEKMKEEAGNLYECMYEAIRSLALDTLERYREQGIDEEIYYETMSDIDVWANDYFRRHGRYGIKEFEWVEKSIDMKLFKLGRLQFEKLEDEESKKTLGLGSEAVLVGVHIQEGGPLDHEKCMESYAWAKSFYLVGTEGELVFVCDSWLLNPKLKSLLGEESNIVKFQSQYEIISENGESRQMESRVFGCVEENPENYIATTSLQRKLKEALKRGERFGTAKGIYRY